MNEAVGKSKTKSYKVTSTNFWITKSKQTVGWSGAKPITKTVQKSAKLANKKASLYPKIKNDHNRVTMPTPKIADMEIVPKKIELSGQVQIEKITRRHT